MDKPAGRAWSSNRIDTWRSRARQDELGDGADAALAWDGRRAWITPGPDAFSKPARFWATTPYYFVGMPFVFADPGTRFEVEEGSLDGVPHDVVRVTYEGGTGDSPDDYYVLYLDRSTHRLAALRYVVAYPAWFEAGQHSPEKLMRVTDPVQVGGLWFAGGLPTHRWQADTQAPGPLVTRIAVSGHELGQRIPASAFAAPDGAVFDESM